jgi:nucleoid-associated protein YgaU
MKNVFVKTMTVGLLMMGLQGCSLLPFHTDDNNSADAAIDTVPVNAEIAVDLTKNAQSSNTGQTGKNPDSKKISRAPAGAPDEPAKTPAKAEDLSDDAAVAKAATLQRHRHNSKRKTLADGEIKYVVKANDTLMKVAFEVFGNVYRWREIYEQNQKKIGKFNSLTRGTVLNIHRAGAIAAAKNGDPYLIKPRDTLWKISDNVYGTPWKWSKLWNNNRELIHDPNHIYAGFYLYYLMTEQERREALLKHPLLGKAGDLPNPDRGPASN